MDNFENYEDFREHINSGDVVFVLGSKTEFRPIQRLIMWATNSQYTHVGVAFWAQMDGGDTPRLMIVESQGGSTRRILNLSYYKDEDMHVVAGPLGWSEVSGTALERLGEAEYGYLDALWVGIREYIQVVSNMNLPKFNFRGETCSELVARMFKLRQVVVSPQTLFEELGSNISKKLEHK